MHWHCEIRQSSLWDSSDDDGQTWSTQCSVAGGKVLKRLLVEHYSQVPSAHAALVAEMVGEGWSLSPTIKTWYGREVLTRPPYRTPKPTPQHPGYRGHVTRQRPERVVRAELRTCITTHNGAGERYLRDI